MPKQSLTMFDGHEDLQDKIENQAFMFAQVALADARRNNLTRDEMIREGTVDDKRTIHIPGVRRKGKGS